MKTPKLFLKIAALFSFVLLLSSFVAYRSGAFDEMLSEDQAQTGLNGVYTNGVDSPPANEDVIIPSSKSGFVMPSSKVLIIKEEPQQDSAKQQKKNTTGNKNSKGQKPANNNNQDNAPNQAPNQSAQPKKQFMGGSKSAPVFYEKTDTTDDGGL